MQNSSSQPSASNLPKHENGRYVNGVNGSAAVQTPIMALPAAFRADMDQVRVPTEPDPPRSLRMRLRFWRIFIYAVQLFGRLVFWNLFVANYLPNYVERTNLRRWQRYARSFRAFAIKTGGVMIKAGQFISTRVDILPPEVTDELAALRDEVPAVPTATIRAIVEQEIGPIDKRFSQFDDRPVAAASIGQVHRARLLDGERVVVKVQRPGIRPICHTDLAALMAVARFAMNFGFVRRRADAVALAREFGRVLLEELSYRYEARNAMRFAAMFKDNLGVYVPAVYPEHSSDTVLTMEDVTTIKISDYAALEAAGISRKAVATRLMDTYLHQIFEQRFFHADPHPGNLFVYPLPSEDGRVHADGQRPFYLIFIDFGMTGTLTPQITGGLVSTLTAVINRDAHSLIASYRQLGFIMPDADTVRIEQATRAVFDQVWGLSMSEMSNLSFSAAQDLGKEFNDLLFSMPFQVPQDFIYLGRTVSILSGMCTSIDPTFNPWSELQPFAQRLAVQFVSGENGGVALGGSGSLLDALLTGNPAQALSAIGQQITRTFSTPQMAVDSLVSRVERGELRFQVDPSAAYQRQLERIESNSKRTGRAVIFGSLLVAATLFYTSGEIVPAVVGYVLSGIAFLAATFGE